VKRLIISLAAGFLVLSSLPVEAAEPASKLLANIEARFIEVTSAAAVAPRGGIERARLLLASGEPEMAAACLGDPPADDVDALVLATRIAFTLHDFDAGKEHMFSLMRRAPENEWTRRLEIQWYIASDDLEGLDDFCQKMAERDGGSRAAMLGRGRLHKEMLRYAESRRWFERALESAQDDWERVRALEGIADIYYDEQKFDSSMVYLERALELPEADDKLLELVNLTLIRLGRVAEAIDAAELAVRINPYSERCQYQLGNGYSRLNYTEIEAEYPGAFPNEEERRLFAEVDSAMSAGDRDRALSLLEEMAISHSHLTGVHVRLGSFKFEEGDFDAALAHFQDGLEACPGNGRARNGIAKSLEGKRLLIDAHRDSYEERFRSELWPEAPGIDEFVINYNSLSDRHKKRVAMSIAPLGAFVPVLVESGSTFYIKPLHERLSSCPGLETLKDARIDYDSRLWDDVRGCGGYSTVTGIEDVERNVLNRYNTVLHELAHQVHGVLTVEENREIQDLYRNAKERHANGIETFVSRYQASSVWEYLAEGVNSYNTPKRDEYDTKQVVRERLETRDRDLLALVEKLMATENMAPYYAVGYANAGYDRLSRNMVDEARTSFEQALGRDPSSPEGTAGAIQVLSIQGDHEDACGRASAALREHPDKARVVTGSVRAFYLRDGHIGRRIEMLETARNTVEARERYLIDLELGEAYYIAGDIPKSIEAYGRVLNYQDDNPEALWGLGAASYLAGDYDASRDYFDRALSRRSGLVELRLDYARALLGEGDVEAARAQLAEAELLAPESAGVAAFRGWLELAAGRPEAAILFLQEAADKEAHNNLAKILLADATLQSGDAEAAFATLSPALDRLEAGTPPEYFYNKKKASFEVVYTFPAYERQLLYDAASRAAGALGREEESARYGSLSNDALKTND
jgi:tetratricopeptide (TPR) repeat protein